MAGVIEHKFELPSRTDSIHLIIFGDVHLGNAECDEKLVAKVAARLQAPNAYGIDLGDALEAINMRDPRFDLRSLPDWIGVEDLGDLPARQIARYCEYFRPVADKLLCRLTGNHEDSLFRWYGRDVYAELNRELGIPPERCPGWWCFLRLRFTRLGKVNWTLTLFLHHGYGGGRLAGSKALNLERLPMLAQADIYAMGHTHTKMVITKRQIRLPPRGKKIEEMPLILINVGSFLRSYSARDTYIERRLLYPQGLGPVELHIWPEQRKRIIKIIQ